MQVLVIGSGGREHALVWKLSHSPLVTKIYVAPGNGGTGKVPKAENISIPLPDAPALLAFALEKQISLTIVGPEEPLVRGIAGAFQRAGLRIFGPSQEAAQLEGSKAFAKAFMQAQGIPTARAQIFQAHDEALAFVRRAPALPVIKVSGLAAGKGVFVPDTLQEAEAALRQIFVEKRFGLAGKEVVIEERLEGPELSVLAFCDGTHYRLMPAAQDHKRLRDGDAGPNTGGMGAFAPAPLATPELLHEIEARVIQPTMEGMAAREMPYVGVLYAGIIVTNEGPKVLEFNCRFGDPETQVILPLLESDLVEVCLACVEGRLDEMTLHWRPGAAVTVVMAANGYPDNYPKGHAIAGVDAAAALPDVVPFQAGTVRVDEWLVTAGGRVMAVTGVGDTLAEAQQRAYEGVAQVKFEGAFYRKDIGQKAMDSKA